jgi:hypothetical protein
MCVESHIPSVIFRAFFPLPAVKAPRLLIDDNRPWNFGCGINVV